MRFICLAREVALRRGGAGVPVRLRSRAHEVLQCAHVVGVGLELRGSSCDGSVVFAGVHFWLTARISRYRSLRLRMGGPTARVAVAPLVRLAASEQKQSRAATSGSGTRRETE